MKAAVPAWARESGSRRLEAGWGLPPLAAALCPGGSYPPVRRTPLDDPEGGLNR